MSEPPGRLADGSYPSPIALRSKICLLKPSKKPPMQPEARPPEESLSTRQCKVSKRCWVSACPGHTFRQLDSKAALNAAL